MSLVGGPDTLVDLRPFDRFYLKGNPMLNKHLLAVVAVAVALCLAPAASGLFNDNFDDGNSDGWTTSHSYAEQGTNTRDADECCGVWVGTGGNLKLQGDGTGSTTAGDYSSLAYRYNMPPNLAEYDLTPGSDNLHFQSFSLTVDVTFDPGHPNYHSSNGNFFTIGLFNEAGDTGYMADQVSYNNAGSWLGMNIRRMNGGDLTNTKDVDGRLASYANGEYFEWDENGDETPIEDPCGALCVYGEADSMQLNLSLSNTGVLTFTTGEAGGSISVTDPTTGGALSQFSKIRLYHSWATAGATFDNVVLDAVIPEPASLMLLGAGGLFLLRRNRRAA